MQTATRSINWRMVRAYCRMFNVSFSKLARESGYTRSYLYMMESTGKNGPEAPSRLARVLGVTASAILKEEMDGEETT